MNNSELIELRNEVDRYGFSFYLANQMNLNFVPRSFANWQHGWYWGSVNINELDLILGYPLKKNYNIPTIVQNAEIKKAFIAKGFREVIAGGIPFSYIKKSKSTRVEDSIIVILPHSLEYTNFSKNDDFNDLILSIKALSKIFTKVSCLVYYDDFRKKTFNKFFKNTEIDIISGARSNSKNALSNIRSIFDKYEYAVSNCIGSAILYAMFCECKVSLLEPFFNYSYDFWKTDPYLRDNKNLIDLMEYHHSKKYLKIKYGFLFNENPKDAEINYEMAKDLIGIDYKLELEKIKTILGWGISSKPKVLLRLLHRKLVGI